MAAARLNLDGEAIKPLKICMIGAGGFIGSHLCEKLMFETDHSVLAVDIYSDKINQLLQPGQKWSDRIEFHRINIKNDSRLEGLVKVSDLVSRDIRRELSCLAPLRSRAPVVGVAGLALWVGIGESESVSLR